MVHGQLKKLPNTTIQNIVAFLYRDHVSVQCHARLFVSFLFSPLVVFSRFHTCLFGSICVRQRWRGGVFFCFFSIAFLFRRGTGGKRGRKALSLFCGVFYAWPFVDRISTKCIQFKIAIHLTCVFFSHVFHFYLDFFFLSV